MGRQYSRVAVLKGGTSSEREVSLRSGAAVAEGLRKSGYEVVEIDVDSSTLSIPEAVEAVFIVLHGSYGEDGGVQQLLIDREIPFTGSGARSCALSFDKILTRQCLLEGGVPVAPGEVLFRAEHRTMDFPLVAKPPREGSSVGCHMVQDESAWESVFNDVQRYSEDVLVEQYIPGRELTVGVIDSGAGSLDTLPIVEIVPAGEWYDFQAKYVTGNTTYQVPARLDEAMAARLSALAVRTFELLGASGFGRVDFRLSPEGDPYVLELNAIPGFTESSLLPKAAAAAGIAFPDLCSRLMEQARIHTH